MFSFFERVRSRDIKIFFARAPRVMQLLKGTAGVTPDTSSVPDNCIIFKGGVLECRDSLTRSISFSNQSRS